MEYSIGKYKVVPQKPFSSMEKAVEYIQGKYPELDKVTIEKFLTPKITTDGTDKSGNLSEESSASDQGESKVGSASAKRIKSESDKPG